MMLLKLCLILLAACCVSDVVKCVDVEGRKKNEADLKDNVAGTRGVFEATSEWQPLPRDMAIPRGLHVRVNLQTGQREAKLIEPEEENEERFDLSSLGMQEDGDIPPITSTVSAEELKHILHKIEKKEPLVPEEDPNNVKLKYRSYEELKKEMYHMNAEIKTDMEILSELMDSYKVIKAKKSKPDFSESTDQEELNVLINLEYLVHQIDNAREFVKTGLTGIVFPALNSTAGNVRYEAAKLLGAAVQSNPKAQIAALEEGSINILLRILSFDHVAQVKSGVLYALSCLVRNFPAAQGVLVSRGGISVLSSMFNTDTSQHTKLQMKVLELVNDLILEKREAERMVLELSGNASDKYAEQLREKLRQYNSVGLEKKLQAEGWCGILAKLLERQEVILTDDKGREEDASLAQGSEEAVLRGDHETVENIVSIMVSMTRFCRSEFSSDTHLRTFLEGLNTWYSELSLLENDETGYFTTLSIQVSNVLSNISSTLVKDEL